jgi:hypothetical protein
MQVNYRKKFLKQLAKLLVETRTAQEKLKKYKVMMVTIKFDLILIVLVLNKN